MVLASFDKKSRMRDDIHSIISNDSVLIKLNNLKERLIGLHSPKIMFNLVTEKLEYVVQNDDIKKIDVLIDERIKELKIKYRII